MRTTLEALRSFSLKATDHDLGHVKDCYVDDRHWAIRYLVVDTNKWLPGRKVLIAPAAVKDLDLAMKELKLNLTRQQVVDSPHVEAHLPMSQQVAHELDRHYGWNHYWITGGLVGFGMGPVPSFGPIVEPTAIPDEFTSIRESLPLSADPNLQSLHDLKGYKVVTRTEDDGDIAGTVVDALINWHDAAVPFLVVDTGHWLPGRSVVLPTALIESIDHLDQTIMSYAKRSVILDAPAYAGLASLAEGGDRAVLAHYRSQFLSTPSTPPSETLGRPATPESGAQTFDS